MTLNNYIKHGIHTSFPRFAKALINGKVSLLNFHYSFNVVQEY